MKREISLPRSRYGRAAATAAWLISCLICLLSVYTCGETLCPGDLIRKPIATNVTSVAGSNRVILEYVGAGAERFLILVQLVTTLTTCTRSNHSASAVYNLDA